MFRTTKFMTQIPQGLKSVTFNAMLGFFGRVFGN